MTNELLPSLKLVLKFDQLKMAPIMTELNSCHINIIFIRLGHDYTRKAEMYTRLTEIANADGSLGDFVYVHVEHFELEMCRDWKPLRYDINTAAALIFTRALFSHQISVLCNLSKDSSLDDAVATHKDN